MDSGSSSEAPSTGYEHRLAYSLRVGPCPACDDAAHRLIADGRHLDDLSWADVPEEPPSPPQREIAIEPTDEADVELDGAEEVDPAELVAEQAAIDMAPSNRQRRIRRQAVAGGEVEYFPGAWSQTWAVTWHAKSGGWTAFDQRYSEDGEGEMDQEFSRGEDASAFIVGEVAHTAVASGVSGCATWTRATMSSYGASWQGCEPSSSGRASGSTDARAASRRLLARAQTERPPGSAGAPGSWGLVSLRGCTHPRLS